MLGLIIFYAFAWMLSPRSISEEVMLAVCFLHAAAWCLIHYVGLGLLLRAQGRSKFLVRHFMKNYHYPDGGKGAVVEAFTNWKAIYNMSMCMTYGMTTFLLFSDESNDSNVCICQSPVLVLLWRHTWYQTIGVLGTTYCAILLERYAKSPFTVIWSWCWLSLAFDRSSRLGLHGVLRSFGFVWYALHWVSWCILLINFLQVGSLGTFSWRNFLPILNTRVSIGIYLDGIFSQQYTISNPKTLTSGIWITLKPWVVPLGSAWLWLVGASLFFPSQSFGIWRAGGSWEALKSKFILLYSSNDDSDYT